VTDEVNVTTGGTRQWIKKMALSETLLFILFIDGISVLESKGRLKERTRRLYELETS
jgi:hypothetical protein